MDRPVDCTCDHEHEDDVDSRIPDSSIAILLHLSDCPAEQRIYRRILESRRVTRQWRADAMARHYPS